VRLLKQVNDVLSENAKLEQPPKLEGRFMSIILAPAKALPVAKPEQTETANDNDKADGVELEHAEAENA